MKGRAVAGTMREPAKKTISRQDKKDLKTLADDFGLLGREDVQEAIETCNSYAEGQREMMRVYTAVYLN